MGEEIIALQERAYHEATKMYPDAEPHYWLWQARLSRMAAQGKNAHDPDIQRLAFEHTLQLACIPPYKNARALGLFTLASEREAIYDNFPKFSSEFNRLMATPVAAMENNLADALYAIYNPSMARDLAREEGFSTGRLQEFTSIAEHIRAEIHKGHSDCGDATLFNSRNWISLMDDGTVHIGLIPPVSFGSGPKITKTISLSDLDCFDYCSQARGNGADHRASIKAFDVLIKVIALNFMLPDGDE